MLGEILTDHLVIALNKVDLFPAELRSIQIDKVDVAANLMSLFPWTPHTGRASRDHPAS